MPSVPPAAPHAGSLSEALCARIKKYAAVTLTNALATCSNICETAVGSIVFLPWKSPLNVPIIATMNIVGASIFNGIDTPLYLEKNWRSSQSAPKYTKSAALPPVITDTSIEYLKIL